jgi:hypothetical protein
MPVDRGGWRYVRIWRREIMSDLSVTSWHLLFLRSAKNAGFDVPAQYVDEGLAFVRRCYDSRRGTFVYAQRNPTDSPGMAGAGALSLSLGGAHQTGMARQAGDWILRYPFDRYNVGRTRGERYHYGAFYCSLAMFQLGGQHWERFYPRLSRTLVASQDMDGSWEPETHDAFFGNVYSTALVVLALTPPYQMLPICQR